MSKISKMERLFDARRGASERLNFEAYVLGYLSDGVDDAEWDEALDAATRYFRELDKNRSPGTPPSVA